MDTENSEKKASRWGTLSRTLKIVIVVVSVYLAVSYIAGFALLQKRNLAVLCADRDVMIAKAVCQSGKTVQQQDNQITFVILDKNGIYADAGLKWLLSPAWAPVVGIGSFIIQ